VAKESPKKLLLKHLENMPNALFMEWERGYMMGCADSLNDVLEMLEEFKSRAEKRALQPARASWLKPLGH
jgi:hypothetical protein